MPTNTPFRTTPQLGPDLFQVVRANQVWYDGAKQIASPQLGVTETGDDGFTYMWVQATGAIAAAAAPGTQVTLTLTPGGANYATAASGAGGWYAPNSTNVPTALAAGDRFWARKGTAP